MKKYVLLILMLFILVSCNQDKDIENYIEIHESEQDFNSKRLKHESRFVSFIIYQGEIEDEVINIISLSNQDEEVEVRYYCGIDDTGDFLGVIEPSYLYNDEYWGTIDTSDCDDLHVFVSVYHFDDGFNEWVGYFEHK